MGTKKYKLLTLLLLLMFLTTLLAGCKEDNTDNDYTSEVIFLENSRGTFTLAEVVLPKDHDGSMPLVAVAHGFTGSIDSGGAAELTRRLAASGIAAIRVDFDAYLTPDESIAKGEPGASGAPGSSSGPSASGASGAPGSSGASGEPGDPLSARFSDAARAREYTLRDMEDDMVSAIGYMIGHYDIDTDRLGLYGRSMGGRVCMMMANESYGGYDYRAMALVAPAGNRDAMISFMGGLKSWQKMKQDAASKGFVLYKQLRLRPDWFRQFEAYNPCDHGDQFGDRPVLVICNTLDYVVTDETSRECAASYQNSRIIEVTTQDHHGYEMSYKKSELKDQLMGEIVAHFKDAFA